MDNRNSTPPPVPEDFIPEGRYPVIAVSHGFGEGKQEGQIAVACQFQEGPGKGQTRTWYGSFSDGAIEFTVRGLRAFGWKGDDPRDMSTIYPKHGGRVAIAVLAHELYEGKWREKINWINDDGVALSKPLEGQAFEKFASRMRNIIPKVEGRSGGNPQSMGGGYGQGNAQTDSGGYGNGQDRRSGQGYGRRDEPPPPDDRDAPPDRGTRKPW